MATNLNWLLDTTDARAWAAEWCKIAREIEGAGDDREVINESWMVTWFAGAIETGRKAGPTPRDLLFDSLKQS